MASFIDTFIKQNKDTFNKYKEYLGDEENDWINRGTLKDREGLYDLEYNLVFSVLDRLKYFVDKAKADLDNRKVSGFIKMMVNSVREHQTRVEEYMVVHDWTTEDDTDKKKAELSFQNDIFKKTAKLIDGIDKLGIEEDTSNGLAIRFFENKKASLAMYDIINRLYPRVREEMNRLKINTRKKPAQEMFIYKKKVPEYNPDKNFWEQEKETIQFFTDEMKKIRNGITIDGVFIHPWLYFHLNFFKAMIPQEDGGDKIMNPPFRDNELFMITQLMNATKRQEIFQMVGARRMAKSTFISSYLLWVAITNEGSELVVAGGSSKDLNQIAKNCKIGIQNMHPAFVVYNNTNDWSKKVSLGLKKTSSNPIEQSVINIVNLVSGGKLNSELLAGYTPKAVVFDEIYKYPFLESLRAIKPALQTEWGWRTIPIMTGTAGNEDLSKDGFRSLKNPATFGMVEMDWDSLERHVPKEDITWKRGKFGVFAPAQMSLKDGLEKTNSNLAEYFSKPESKELKKIKILTTNWALGKKILEEAREKAKGDLKELQKEIIYFPIDPQEIFLSGKTNPFPVMAAKKHRDYLVETGQTGKKVELYRSTGGSVKYSLSEKEIPDFPFEGGYIDSPVVLYEDLPDTKPPSGLYVAGLDDYAQQQSDTDSVGSFHIFKRNTITDPWGDRPVASYASRPDPHSDFHNEGLMLLEAYNAKCFMENADMLFKEMLDRLHKVDTWLYTGLDFASEFGLNSTEKRQIGWTPTPKNKSFLLGVVIKYCKEQIETIDEDGNKIMMVGVQRINDIRLLDEIINYREGANFDRIISFGSALIYANYMDVTYQSPDYKKETTPRKLPSSSGFYSNRRFSAF